MMTIWKRIFENEIKEDFITLEESQEWMKTALRYFRKSPTEFHEVQVCFIPYCTGVSIRLKSKTSKRTSQITFTISKIFRQADTRHSSSVYLPDILTVPSDISYSN